MGRISYVITSLIVLVVLSIGAAPAAAQSPDKPVRARASAGPSAPVNLNTATQSQLESLPGIGASTAKRIVEYRQKSGGFKKIEELMNVKGIGEKSFLKLKPHVTVAAEKADRPAEKQ